MFVTRRRLLLWAALAALAFSPAAVGALPRRADALALAALYAFSVYAFSFAHARRPARAALVLLSACFAVALFDLAARPVVYYLYERDWPAARFVRRWPTLPLLPRYVPGLNFDGVTYGDLAARAWREDWREPRRVRFVTDAYGFRDEPRGAGDGERALDVILLGDSFGAPAGTSQEQLLSSLLERDYRLSVYNLSVSSSSPQQEYVTLLLEGPRLKTREGTRALWLLYEGNDLDDPPPWTSSVEPSGLSDVLAGLCARQGFRFLDLKPALVEASRRAYEESGALLWWRDDTHWNDAGQRAAAAVCEQLLECADRGL